jgi:hypothetical protein
MDLFYAHHLAYFFSFIRMAVYCSFICGLFSNAISNSRMYGVNWRSFIKKSELGWQGEETIVI